MGEFDLLERMRKLLPETGPRVRLDSGDDAAVTVPGGATATSVDAVVDGVHFRRPVSSPRQIGHKALATALSDLAAMGAEPGEAYVALGVPPDLSEDECLELVEGMSDLARATGTSLVGGDLSRCPALTLTVTVVGHAPDPEDFVSRAGAREGDILAVTGQLGGAAAGLHLLDRPDLATDLDGATLDSLRLRQLTPTPRLAAGRALAAAGATAMIDLSDGLAGDAAHIAERSGCGVSIEVSSIPLDEGVAAVAAALGRDPVELAAGGGEDYELLAALPPDRLAAAQTAVEQTGLQLTAIGRITAGSEVAIRRRDGTRLTIAGFDQLS